MAKANFCVPPRLTWIARLLVTLLIYMVGLFWAFVWAVRQPAQIFRDPLNYFTVKKRLKAPSVLRGTEIGEHGYLQLPNGMRIHYVSSGDFNSPFMLFLHGFPDFWYSWRHQVKHFSNRYHVVAVDLRGYGDSGKLYAVEEYTIHKLMEDVKLIIESLGYRSCILVGHDFGGSIAWAFSTLFPEMVQKLVTLSSPHPKVLWRYMLRNPKQFVMSWYKFVFQLPYLPEFAMRCSDLEIFDTLLTKPPMGMKSGSMSPVELEAYKYTFSAHNALTAPVNYYRNMFGQRPDQTVKWRPVTCPVLVVLGTADQVISSETALLSGQYVAGQFEVKYLEGISHWVHMEAPDQVNLIMDQFLSS